MVGVSQLFGYVMKYCTTIYYRKYLIQFISHMIKNRKFFYLPRTPLDYYSLYSKQLVVCYFLHSIGLPEPRSNSITTKKYIIVLLSVNCTVDVIAFQNSIIMALSWPLCIYTCKLFFSIAGSWYIDRSFTLSGSLLCNALRC